MYVMIIVFKYIYMFVFWDLECRFFILYKFRLSFRLSYKIYIKFNLG